MKRKFTFAFATMLAFTLLFTTTLATDYSSDIRVDEAVIETSEGKAPVMVITGEFPTSTPMDVVLTSGGMTRAMFRVHSNDGRKIVVSLEGVADADSSNLQVSVTRAGMSARS